MVGKGGHGMNIMMQNNKWVEPNYDATHRVAEVVVERVVAAGMANQTLLTAFDIKTIAHARNVCGDCGIRTGWLALSERATGVPWGLAWIVSWFRSCIVPWRDSSQYLDKVEAYGLDALVPEATILDDALLEEARRCGIQVFVWWMGVNTTSCETPENMQELANRGVTGFITPQVTMGIAARVQAGHD